MTNRLDDELALDPAGETPIAAAAEAAPAPGEAADRWAVARDAMSRRRRVLSRMWAAAEGQLAEIELRLTAMDAGSTDIERDARTLAILARVVRELNAQSSAASRRQGAARRPARAPQRGRGVPVVPRTDTDEEGHAAPIRNLDQLREELARHLERLRDEAGTPRPSGEPG